MEIYLLRTFVTVAQHGHVTRAANTLHLTQSTVSGHIKALEGEWGVSLFVRTAAGVALTSAGQALFPKAQELLAKSVELQAHAGQFAAKVGRRVRLSVLNDAELLNLASIMAGMREQYPDIMVELQHGLSGWTLNEVKSGKCEAGFFIGDVTEDEVKAVKLKELDYCIVAPPAWEEQIKSAGWAEIGSMPWIYVASLSSYPRLMAEIFAQHGIEPTKVVECDRGGATTQSLVTAGVGLSLLRADKARMAAKEGKLVIWEEGKTRADLSFIYLAAREKDPQVEAPLSIVRRIWQTA
jgi:DNA-binding transcriptional LysR family regulator